MNSDTLRTFNQIKANGYWRQGTTLGEGGWEAVNKLNVEWFSYFLEINGEIVEEIRAKNDGIAINAFETLYNLSDEIEWEVYQKIVKFRTLAGNV